MVVSTIISLCTVCAASCVVYMITETKKYAYKYCIVPMCQSTTVKTPSKRFFRVPSDMNKRKKWCKVMRRDLIGPKSTTYVCEDHFDVENDTENLVKCRLVGGTLKLKANVYPHKFDCQGKPKKEKEACEKRCRIEYIENLLTQEVATTSNQLCLFQSFEMIECNKMESNEARDPLPEDIIYTESVPDDHANKKENKGVQVNIKISQKNKAVQTIINKSNTKDAAKKGTKIVYIISPQSSPSRISIPSLSSSSNVSIFLQNSIDSSS